MKKTPDHTYIKIVLFFSVIGMLFLPMTQQELKWIELEPLNGSYTTLEKPVLKPSNWLEGNYQSDLEKYLDQEVGFRNFFVRIYNQTYYSLFNQARANNVTVGKKNYLYDISYINAYLGRDFVGQDMIERKISKLQKISDTLKAQDIDIIIVFAPGKGSFYPEFIPDKFDSHRKTLTNHKAYVKELSKSTIHFLDLNQWFINQKATSPYPLFPKTGIHWSLYGEILAFDSLTKYVESIRDIHLPKFHIDRIETSFTVRDTDDDVEKGMNLLFDIKDLKMGYPVLSFQESDTDTKLKVITVADSYYWGVFGKGISGRIFKDEQFWYYNKEIHAYTFSEPKLVKDVNIRTEVESKDVIILLFTDANLSNFDYGFINQLYDAYFKIK